MKHTNEADAKREFKIAIEERNKKYCPALRGYCRMDCVCYAPGKKPFPVVRSTAKGTGTYWVFYTPSCEHTLHGEQGLVVTVES